MPAHPAFSGLTTFGYDPKDQLTAEQSARNGGYNYTHAYDAAANPTTFRGASRSYNAKNQDTAHTFDGAGNPTLYGGIALTWDVESRLVGVGANWSAAYRADSLRAWKQHNGTRTYFLYDGTTPVVELDAAGNAVAVNTFGVSGLLARRSGGSSVFYSFDPQGNVSQRLGTGGTVLSSHLYDAYGQEASSAATTDPFGYGGQAGYYQDAETGLHQLTFRYYDTAAGRFLNRDPIGYAGGVNLYGYVGNNPTGYSDPLGLCRSRDPLFWLSDGFAGFGDCSTVGTTYKLRESQGNDVVDCNSPAYAVGYFTAIPVLAVTFWAGSGGGAAAGAASGTAVPAGVTAGGAVAAAGAAAGGAVATAPAAVQTQLNITHSGAITGQQALRAAVQWLGPGYRECLGRAGQAGSGVFRSADGLRQFRMAPSDLAGSHGNIGAHVHFQVFDRAGREIQNLHVPLQPGTF